MWLLCPSSAVGSGAVPVCPGLSLPETEASVLPRCLRSHGSFGDQEHVFVQHSVGVTCMAEHHTTLSSFVSHPGDLQADD